MTWNIQIYIYSIQGLVVAYLYYMVNKTDYKVDQLLFIYWTDLLGQKMISVILAVKPIVPVQ